MKTADTTKRLSKRELGFGEIFKDSGLLEEEGVVADGAKEVKKEQDGTKENTMHTRIRKRRMPIDEMFNAMSKCLDDIFGFMIKRVPTPSTEDD